MNNIVSYILFGVIIVALFVYMIIAGRQQKKAQNDYMAMLDTLRPGVKVKMASGLLGRIKEIREEAPGFKTVTLNVGEGKNVTEMTFVIEAVQGIVNEEAINKLNMEKMAAEAEAQETAETESAETKINGEPVSEPVKKPAKKSTSKRK